MKNIKLSKEEIEMIIRHLNYYEPYPDQHPNKTKMEERIIEEIMEKLK